MCEYNHSFGPSKDSDVHPGIDANNNKYKNNENEDNNYEAYVNNNNATLDDEYGDIIINDGPIEYDEFNIPIAV